MSFKYKNKLTTMDIFYPYNLSKKQIIYFLKIIDCFLLPNDHSWFSYFQGINQLDYFFGLPKYRIQLRDELLIKNIFIVRPIFVKRSFYTNMITNFPHINHGPKNFTMSGEERIHFTRDLFGMDKLTDKQVKNIVEVSRKLTGKLLKNLLEERRKLKILIKEDQRTSQITKLSKTLTHSWGTEEISQQYEIFPKKYEISLQKENSASTHITKPSNPLPTPNPLPTSDSLPYPNLITSSVQHRIYALPEHYSSTNYTDFTLLNNDNQEEQDIINIMKEASVGRAQAMRALKMFGDPVEAIIGITL